MMNTNKALTGKRVYRMSSHAPTRGTNNPSGYIKRELRNDNKPERAQRIQPLKPAEPVYKKAAGNHGVSKVGNDGQSDTRSGLASKMKPPPRNITKLPSRPRPRVAGIVKAAGMTGGAAMAAHNKANIAINNNGRLDLPFDYSASQNALEQQQQANQSLLDLQSQQQQHAQEYLKGLRDAQQGYTGQQRQTLNDNAARGTAFSSGYGVQVGQNATNYNNAVNDLGAQNTQFNNSIEAQRTAVNTGLQDYLRQQALARAVKLDNDAGTLGFGVSKAKPVLAKARPRVKAIAKKGRK
jgi:hypothetical protein